MKIFTNKSIWRKIVIALLIVLLFNIVVMKPIHAADASNDVLEGGGKLLKPIFSLLVTIGDGVINVLHSSVMGVDETLIVVNNESEAWGIIKTIIAVIVTAACIIGAIILSGGIAAILGGIAVLSIASSVLFGSNIIVGLEDEISYAIVTQFNEEALPSKLYFPAYSYSPEEIFRGNVLLFNVNFFREPIVIKEATKKDEDGNDILAYYYYEDSKGEELDTDGDGNADTKGFVTSKQDSAAFLQKTVSSWYNAIRNICLVLMLSVLVYIGIRILLSSVASDKAKYQTMLKDWFVGLCLLFLMHYIMAFSVTIVDKITGVVSTSLDNNKYMAFIPKTDKIEEDLEELGMADSLKYEENGREGYMWPSNLMGYLRLKAQINTNGWQYIGEAIMFLILTIFTVMFTVTYLKRLLYMTFLTILAPLVALTYCIDKLNDGQAQGFNKWLKEYIFNLLIQPVHLLLYYILITSSFETMGKNVIYSIVAIGFMIPAEKLLRSLFGFEKAHTPPAIGPATATMAASVLSGILHKKSGAGGKGDGASGSDSSSDKVPKPREANPIDAFLNGDSGSDSGSDSSMPGSGTSGSGMPGSGESGNSEGHSPNTEQGDSALDKYRQEGYGQNDKGEYYNPWTDEYDPNYDPRNDSSYAQSQESDSVLDKYTQEGYGQNDKGEYFNPWLDEYDTNYDPHNDASYQQLEEPSENSTTSSDEPTTSSGNPTMSSENPVISFDSPTASSESPTTSSDSSEGKGKKKKIRRAIQRRAHAYTAVGKTAMRKGLKNLPGRAIRMAGRVAAGTAVGALAGGAGIAIGAATGDLNNVIKMGAGSAASGFALGSGGIKNAGVKQEYKDAYKEAMNSKEYKEEAQADYVKEYRKNIDNRRYFEEKFGAKEAREMLKKGGEVEQYLNYGITDKTEMKAMHKLQQKKVVNSVEEAIAVSQLGTMIGKAPDNMSTKKQKEWKTTIGNMAGKSGVKDTEKFAQDRFDQIQKLYDFKK